MTWLGPICVASCHFSANYMKKVHSFIHVVMTISKAQQQTELKEEYSGSEFISISDRVWSWFKTGPAFLVPLRETPLGSCGPWGKLTWRKVKHMSYLLSVSVAHHSWSHSVSCIISHHISPSILNNNNNNNTHVSCKRFIRDIFCSCKYSWETVHQIIH